MTTHIPTINDMTAATTSRDIYHGRAVVPYAGSSVSRTTHAVPTVGASLQPGWVLPGGRRTNSRAAAEAAAVAMHEYMLSHVTTYDGTL